MPKFFLVRALISVVGVSAYLAFASASQAADGPGLYHISKTIPLGAPERWDYLSFEPTSNRLFVTHSDRIDVIDLSAGKVVGQAESAIVKGNLANGIPRTERRVELSPDGKSILVQDDVSEAYPSRRYILFELKPDGTFETFYLAPPIVPIPEGQVSKVNYTLPWIHFNDPGFAYYPRFQVPFNR